MFTNSQKNTASFDFWIGGPDWPVIVSRIGLLIENKPTIENDSVDISHNVMIDKLVTLGEMTAGVMHEINRPLTLINGNLDRIKKHIHGTKILDEEKLFKAIEKSELGTERAIKLVKSLVGFVRNSADDKFERIVVKDLFSDVEILCSAKLYSSHIPLTFPKDDEANIDAFEGRASEIAQVLINLVSNACDALVENNVQNPFIRIDLKDDGEFIEFRVVDAGAGIDPVHLPRIFQSLYTTKGVGKGTGLGLSLSKRIAEEHSGTLSVDQSHQNTCFVLRLPKKQC